MDKEDGMITDEDLKMFCNRCDLISTTEKRYSIDNNTKGWSNAREKKYKKGIVQGMYVEKDKLLMELIKKKCDENKLKFLLEQQYIESQKKAKDLYNSTGIYMQASNSSPNDDFLQWFDDRFSDLIQDIKNQGRNAVLSYVYLYEIYELHSRRNKIGENQANIIEIYKNDSDSSYDKYGLIRIGENIELIEDAYPQIYDKRHNKTILLITDRYIVHILSELYKRNYIGLLAFRGKNDFIFGGRLRRNDILAGREYGKLFSFDIDNLPAINKFYSREYNNQLWIKVDNNEMTFEELRDDLSIEDGAIITQVIHLRYNDSNNIDYYIEHIDHEYIFYKEDEYAKRMNSGKIKGTAKTRIKTFKVDQAKIPFNYQCDTFQFERNVQEHKKVAFIFCILNHYFQNKDLLQEYFEDIR